MARTRRQNEDGATAQSLFPRCFEIENVDSNKISPRSGQRSVIIGDILYIIGGFNPELSTQIMDEINRFSLTQNRWLESLVPTGSASKCMASHAATSYGRFIIIHGGSALPFGTVKKRALYAYDTQNGEWFHLDKNLSDENGLSRGIYGHTINIINGTVYIVGGTSGNLYFNSVYSFDLDSKVNTKWEILFEQDIEAMEMDDDEHENVPAGRYRHETAVFGDYLIMIGGGEQTRIFDINKLYFFNVKKRKWTKVMTANKELLQYWPLSRKCHSLNQVGNVIYIMGGQTITEQHQPVTLSDVWKLDLNPNNDHPSNYEPKKTKFIWEPVGQTKIPCHFHSSSYNAKSNSIYMFGGNTVVNMGGRGHDIVKRINLLSSLQLSPPTLQHISKRAAYKAHDGNAFIQRQLDESNIVSPSPA